MSSGLRSWGTSLLSDGLVRAGRRYASMVGAEGGVVHQGGPPAMLIGGGGGSAPSRRLQTATTSLLPTPQTTPAPPSDAVRTTTPARRHRTSGVEEATSSQPTTTTWLKGEGEADSQDPLLFTHLHTHHDPASGRLTYYEYRARRHAHVVLLDELGAHACHVTSHTKEATVLRFAAHVGKALANLTVGSIAVSSKLNCTTASPTAERWDPLFRGRVAAPPVIETVHSEGGVLLVTLRTAPVRLHECFEHADIEYYSGSPSGLSAARAARERSLTTSNYEIPPSSFASSHAIVQSAQRKAGAALEAPKPSSKVLRRRPVGPEESGQLAESGRRLQTASCGSAQDGQFSMLLSGSDCSGLSPGGAMDAADCYWGVSADDDNGDVQVSLKAGNTYTLKWASQTNESNVRVSIYESDAVSTDDYCLDLVQAGSWVSNRLYSGALADSPNTFTFTLPDLLSLPCGEDHSFPEFYFRIETESGCHRGGWGEFRLLRPIEHSGSFTMQVPSNYRFEASNNVDGGYGHASSSAGGHIACNDCHITATADVHVLMRTTNVNPLDEVWAWGDLSLLANVDVEISAEVAVDIELPVNEIIDTICVAPVCVGVSVAGVGFHIGLIGRVYGSASWTLNLAATFSYQRTMSTSGSLALHTKGATILYKNMAGFGPSPPPDGAASQPAQLTLDLDTTSKIGLNPALLIGVFSSLTVNVGPALEGIIDAGGDAVDAGFGAEAFICADLTLELTAHFSLRTAIGTSNFLAPIADEAACTDALLGCSQDCSQNHNVRIGYDLSLKATGYYQMYVEIGAWSGIFAVGQQIGGIEPTYLYSLEYQTPIGSWCYTRESHAPSGSALLGSPSSELECPEVSTRTTGCAVEGQAMTRQYEGVRAGAYIDTKGHPTIGVGFNLDRTDADAVLGALQPPAQTLSVLGCCSYNEAIVTYGDDQCDASCARAKCTASSCGSCEPSQAACTANHGGAGHVLSEGQIQQLLAVTYSELKTGGVNAYQSNPKCGTSYSPGCVPAGSGAPTFDELCCSVQNALIDMAFNMGAAGLSKFPKMLAAIGNRDWAEAGHQARDSSYYRQGGRRARQIAQMMVRARPSPILHTITATQCTRLAHDLTSALSAASSYLTRSFSSALSLSDSSLLPRKMGAGRAHSRSSSLPQVSVRAAQS